MRENEFGAISTVKPDATIDFGIYTYKLAPETRDIYMRVKKPDTRVIEKVDTNFLTMTKSELNDYFTKMNLAVLRSTAKLK